MDALDAATQVAREWGLDVTVPRVLRATNHTVAWLPPAPVVAKISRRGWNGLAREQAVAVLVSEAGGPLVGPSELLPPGVHELDDWAMTVWPYHSQTETETEPEPAALARALHLLQEALESASPKLSPLPRWDLAPQDVRRRLGNPSFAAPLALPDRTRLAAALARCHEVGLSTTGQRVLHGSPHGYNVLMVEGRPRFIDLETVCRGPIEWDLCHLEPDVAAAYNGQFDSAALAVARLVVSAMTAALCWDGIDHGEDMRFHAEHQLAAVRRAAI